MIPPPHDWTALLVVFALIAVGCYLLNVLDQPTWRIDLGVGCIGAAGGLLVRSGWLR